MWEIWWLSLAHFTHVWKIKPRKILKINTLSQTEKVKYHMISFLCGILKKCFKWNYLQNRIRLMGIEIKLMATKGESGRRRNRKCKASDSRRSDVWGAEHRPMWLEGRRGGSLIISQAFTEYLLSAGHGGHNWEQGRPGPSLKGMVGESESHSIVSDSLWPHGLWPARLPCPWDSLGKNTGVGSRSLPQEIFPTQGLNPDLLHCRQILYCLDCQRSAIYLKGKNKFLQSNNYSS